ISNHIDDLAAKGFSSQRIRENVSNEIKLMDYLRDHYLTRSQARARVMMSVHGRSAEDAIKSEIQETLMREYKTANPNYHELPTKILANKWMEQNEEAAKAAKQIKERILGSASSGVIIYKRSETGFKGDVKSIKAKDKQDNREMIKKIREPKF
ncbi:MAG: hypothetical protein ACTSRD_14395, partial [Promethearchaeota archaeon]